MVVYRSGVKRKKKKVETTYATLAAIPTKSIQSTALKRLGVAVPKRAAVIESLSVPRTISSKYAGQLIKKMNLDEMLEASNAVEIGIRGCKLPKIESPNAQKYATAVLGLTRKSSTKPKAEKMLHDLNRRIVLVNQQTTDAIEAKRLYRELMAEE